MNNFLKKLANFVAANRENHTGDVVVNGQVYQNASGSTVISGGKVVINGVDVTKDLKTKEINVMILGDVSIPNISCATLGIGGSLDGHKVDCATLQIGGNLHAEKVDASTVTITGQNTTIDELAATTVSVNGDLRAGSIKAVTVKGKTIRESW